MPLTVQEEAELQRRNEVARGIEGLDDELEATPGFEGAFAGLWIDHAAGGDITVASAGAADVPELVAAARRRATHGARVKGVTVAHSLAELRRAHRALHDAAATLRDEGVELSFIETNILDNRVDVGVLALDNAKTDRIRTVASEPFVHLHPGGHVHRQDSKSNSPGPWKGGTQIHGPSGSCTAGFGAIEFTDPPRKYVITAGHCNGLTTGGQFRHNDSGSTYPLVKNTGAYPDGFVTADAGLIDVRDGLAGNLMVKDPTQNGWVRGVQSSDVLNQTVCMSAGFSTTPWRCGTLRAKNVEVLNPGGPPFINVRRASYGSVSGDSGAPVYSGQGLVVNGALELTGTGVHLGRTIDSSYALYSFLQNAATELGVLVITSSQANRVMMRHSLKCLDVPWGSSDNGVVVQQWTCHPGTMQWFEFVPRYQDWYLRSTPSGKCVDVSGPSTANGALIHQWECWGGDNQRWRLVQESGEHFSLRARHSAKCADIEGVHQHDGARLHQWDCYSGTNQQMLYF
ncbi:MAG TPA: RICIN domain-containing protein [Acidimicrobiales bacterium]